MTRNKKLSDLLITHARKRKRKELFASIFLNYKHGYYFTMVNEITEYGDFAYFLSLARFLKQRGERELWNTFIYRDIMELYYDEITI